MDLIWQRIEAWLKINGSEILANFSTRKFFTKRDRQFLEHEYY